MADAHVHFFSHNFFSSLAGQASITVEAAGTQLGWQLPPPEPETLAATWVHELDRQGVFASALIASIPGDEGSAIAAARAFPQRFFAYAMVNPRALTAHSLASSLAASIPGASRNASGMLVAPHLRILSALMTAIAAGD